MRAFETTYIQVIWLSRRSDSSQFYLVYLAGFLQFFYVALHIMVFVLCKVVLQTNVNILLLVYLRSNEIFA